MNPTRAFDVAEYLDGPEVIVAYLNEILSDGDVSEFIQALGDVARARGMTELAAETGLGRESLYKTLSDQTKPRFDTVVKITQALGIDLSLKAATA